VQKAGSTMKKILLIASIVSLLVACDKEPSTDYVIGKNVKILDNNRKLEFYNNVSKNINSSEYYIYSTADFINHHLSNILHDDEKPLFYDDITLENILNKTTPYPNRSMIHDHWNKGDLIFDKNTIYLSRGVRGGVILYKEKEIFYYVVYNKIASINSIDVKDTIIHQLLVYND
jgi:hypothetical protein